jgi:hypothetical protein
MEAGMPKSRTKVIRKVRKIFPDQDAGLIMEILDQYGLESYETGRTRVQLAILKVFQEGAADKEGSDERLERLRRLVRVAKSDYRDVLAWAEYPEESKKGFVGMKALSPQEAKELREQDREGYRRWLQDR